MIDGSADGRINPGHWVSGEFSRLGRSGFLHVLGAQGVTRVAAVFQGLLLAKILGRDDLGRYAVFASLIALSGIVAQAGVPSALSRYVALDAGADHRSLRDGAGTVAFALSLIVALIVSIPGLRNMISIEPWVRASIPLALLILPFQSITQSSLAWFHGLARLKVKSWLEGIAALLSFAGVISGAYLFGVTGAAWSRGITAGASMVIVMVASRYRFTVRLSYPEGFWRFSLFSLASASFSTLIHTADTLVLAGYRISSGIIGDYRVAAMAYVGLSMIPAAAMHTVFPRLVSLHGRGGDVAGLYRRLLGRLALYGMAMGAAGIFVVPKLVIRILGAEYAGANPFISILSAGLIFRAFVLCAGSTILALGRPGLNFSLLILSGSVNLFLNLILVSSHGAVGAAWATLCTEGLSAVIGTAAAVSLLKGRR